MKVALAVAVAFAMAPMAVSAEVPDLKMKDLDGKEYDLQKLAKDNVVVIYSFSPACPSGKPCIPGFTKLVKEFGKQKNVVFLAVGSYRRESAEQLKAYAEEHELSYPIVHDADKTIARALGAKKVNSTYVFANGKLWKGGVGAKKNDVPVAAIKAGLEGKAFPANMKRWGG